MIFFLINWMSTLRRINLRKVTYILIWFYFIMYAQQAEAQAGAWRSEGNKATEVGGDRATEGRPRAQAGLTEGTDLSEYTAARRSLSNTNWCWRDASTSSLRQGERTSHQDWDQIFQVGSGLQVASSEAVTETPWFDNKPETVPGRGGSLPHGRQEYLWQCCVERQVPRAVSMLSILKRMGYI